MLAIGRIFSVCGGWIADMVKYGDFMIHTRYVHLHISFPVACARDAFFRSADLDLHLDLIMIRSEGSDTNRISRTEYVLNTPTAKSAKSEIGLLNSAHVRILLWNLRARPYNSLTATENQSYNVSAPSTVVASHSHTLWISLAKKKSE